MHFRVEMKHLTYVSFHTKEVRLSMSVGSVPIAVEAAFLGMLCVLLASGVHTTPDGMQLVVVPAPRQPMWPRGRIDSCPRNLSPATACTTSCRQSRYSRRTMS